MGILKRAANTVRALGHVVFMSQEQHQLKIDGVEYDSLHTENIPQIFLPDENSNVPPAPVNINRISLYDRARRKSENAVMIGNIRQITDRGLGFFSAGCYLSNFYKCQIVYQGEVFKSVEHGYQGLKAKICHAPGIYTRIKDVDSPSLAKSYAQDIFVTDEWERVKISIMKDLLFCKFRQNHDLYFKLLNTRPRALLECTLDDFWGTGCRLGSFTAVDGTWTGQNMLGKLLVEVRDQLISENENKSTM